MLVGGCAHDRLGPTPVQAKATATEPAAPAPLAQVEPVFLAPPAPAPPDCDPQDFHFMGWRFKITAPQGGTSVHATPTWGRRGTAASTPIPDACLEAWVGPRGPEWRGDVRGGPDPADPYRFNATGPGRLWACTTTTGDCVDVVI
jgi:hypothetical protein